MKPELLRDIELARDEACEHLTNALEALNDAPIAAATPAQLDLAHRNVHSYLRLAGAALDRIQEAANGR